MQLAIIRDGWIVDKYFELSEREQADNYLAHCQVNYQGCFTLQLVSDGYPRRYEHATLAQP